MEDQKLGWRFSERKFRNLSKDHIRPIQSASQQQGRPKIQNRGSNSRKIGTLQKKGALWVKNAESGQIPLVVRPGNILID